MDKELAHDTDKNANEIPNYKTQLCKNFIHSKCVYGDKCLFAHGES